MPFFVPSKAFVKSKKTLTNDVEKALAGLAIFKWTQPARQ